MIGQKEVLKQIDNLIEKGFPRSIVITGQRGQGKTELVKYISKKLNYPICEFGIKIDEVREMIQMAYKQTEPIIYLIQNADKMSINAQNSLLKLVEEPPNNCYVIIELQQIENTLETIKSRCQEIKMEQYNNLELSEMIEKINPNISYSNKQYITTVAKNYYQINLFNKYGVEEFYNFVEKVVNNIYKVQSANSFKIAEKLDLKDDGNGYDVNLFFEVFKNISLEKGMELTGDFPNCEIAGDFRYLKNVEITSKYQQKLNINGINKRNVIRPMDFINTKRVVKMNLFEIEKPLQIIEEKIKQRRLQMLVHSYIYYELNTNIIDDTKWDRWAMELVDLQSKYPKESKKALYYEEFKDWDGSTGAFLKYDNITKKRAERLLKINEIK